MEQSDRPDKTEYSLTESGPAERIRWVETSPVEPPVIKQSVALRMFLGRVTSLDHISSILDQYADNIDDTVAELEALTIGIADDDGSSFAKMTGRFKESPMKDRTGRPRSRSTYLMPGLAGVSDRVVADLERVDQPITS